MSRCDIQKPKPTPKSATGRVDEEEQTAALTLL